MQKLVVGLGNSGERFKKTRHNAGFLLVDELANSCGKLGLSCKDWQFSNKLESEIVNCHLSTAGDATLSSGVERNAGGDLVFVKPQTGMNSSGRAVGRIFYKKNADLENFLLIHDELDISLGEYKLQRDRTAGGHNGVQSVIDVLGSQDFWRLRVGIGRPPEGVDPADYVLEEFSDKELNMVKSLTENELVAVIKEWIED